MPLHKKRTPQGRTLNQLSPDQPDHNGRPTLQKRRRTLWWGDMAERSRYLTRVIDKRVKKEHMRTPLIEHPCFLCGTSVWSRRMDIFGGVCDECRPKKNAMRTKAKNKHEYEIDPEKYRNRQKSYRRNNPDIQRNIDHRAYHQKQNKIIDGTTKTRDRSSRYAAVRQWNRHHIDNNTWQAVKIREQGRRQGERRTDIRRYTCAFMGEHHKNRYEGGRRKPFFHVSPKS